MLSDKCLPIIRSARLGDNTNEHNLNQNCLDEFKIRRHENSIKNDGSSSGCLIAYKTDQDDFDLITTTYGEHQKQIVDESILYEHR